MDEISQKIVVVDLRIPFFRLVFFLVKLSLAAIPAALILAVLGFVLSAVFAALFGGQMDVFMRRWSL
ncbi:hypothetical protein CCR97_11255 [Rhodoplanes elegans]|uniref:ABC transporter permease n=1 Tax=Rhodoplanes elegans TaxID=29408 RepID=A0A327KQS9_9BRAD|nr:hypothetical protein [Rhodoplanes elegans]MBK5958783.1 hypothetical protein [Rhodoplanes elegans]RAI40791.1 hypothetical protein CH338_05085 [Rhodoplanes elegans]